MGHSALPRAAGGAYPDALRDRFEEYLGRVSLPCDGPIKGLAEAMEYSLLGGGKRIRPVLVLATQLALGGEDRKSVV